MVMRSSVISNENNLSLPPLTTFTTLYRKNEASTQPKTDFVPKTLSDLGVADTLNGGLPSTNVSGKLYSSTCSFPQHSTLHLGQHTFPNFTPVSLTHTQGIYTKKKP